MYCPENLVVKVYYKWIASRALDVIATMEQRYHKP